MPHTEVLTVLISLPPCMAEIAAGQGVTAE